MGLDNTAKAVNHVKIETVKLPYIMRVGSNRLSLKDVSSAGKGVVFY